MAEVDGTLIMSVMRAIQSDTSEIKHDISDLKLRTHVLEDQMGAAVVALAGLNHRIDRLQGDMSLVKRRLDLVDA